MWTGRDGLRQHLIYAGTQWESDSDQKSTMTPLSDQSTPPTGEKWQNLYHTNFLKTPRRNHGDQSCSNTCNPSKGFYFTQINFHRNQSIYCVPKILQNLNTTSRFPKKIRTYLDSGCKAICVLIKWLGVSESGLKTSVHRTRARPPSLQTSHAPHPPPPSQILSQPATSFRSS